MISLSFNKTKSLLMIIVFLSILKGQKDNQIALTYTDIRQNPNYSIDLDLFKNILTDKFIENGIYINSANSFNEQIQVEIVISYFSFYESMGGALIGKSMVGVKLRNSFIAPMLEEWSTGSDIIFKGGSLLDYGDKDDFDQSWGKEVIVQTSDKIIKKAKPLLERLFLLKETNSISPPSKPEQLLSKTNTEGSFDYNIDINSNIPISSEKRPDAIAVVIGNKDYANKDVPSVDFGIEDATIFKKYIIQTLGFDEKNVFFVKNASQSDFNSIFGNEKNPKGKLFNYVRDGKSDIFIYYSGHGAPDPESKQGYFVPVDCDPSTVALNGYSLNTLYGNLSKIKYKSLTVVIDACFSGSSDKGMLIKNVSPVFITVENPIQMKGNTVIFSSAGGEQVSSWYPEKRHSLYTYYFLKAIQGEADANKDKQLTVGEMKLYLDENVPYMARRLNNREQTPQVIGDENRVIVKY